MRRSQRTWRTNVAELLLDTFRSCGFTTVGSRDTILWFFGSGPLRLQL